MESTVWLLVVCALLVLSVIAVVGFRSRVSVVKFALRVWGAGLTLEVRAPQPSRREAPTGRFDDGSLRRIKSPDD
jgi:hypothetical protein